MPGLDALTAEESAEFDAGRNESPDDNDAPAPRETREPRQQREPEPDIEIVADEAPAPEQAQAEKQKTVPHEQFHAERERRKAVQQELQKFREEQAAANARMEERFRMLSQVQKPAEAAPALPDIATDPIQHIDGRFKSQEQQIAELNQFRQQQQQAVQQQQQIAELRNYMASQEVAFSQDTPDYNDAMQYMIQQRHGILAEMGMHDAAQRQSQLANDVAQLAHQARQAGRNPAEMLYRVATASGYKKAAPAPSPIEAVVDAPVVTQAERQVAAIERGRANSTTIGTSGTAPPTRLTPERIANMSDAEFNKVYARVAKDPAAMRAMFGE